MLCFLMTRDAAGFQSGALLLAHLTKDESVSRKFLQHCQCELFELMLLAISEDVDSLSRLLSFCVLCNLSRRDKEAKKLFKQEKVSDKIQEFIFEEKDVLSHD